VCGALLCRTLTHCKTCNALQHTATYCNALQQLSCVVLSLAHSRSVFLLNLSLSVFLSSLPVSHARRPADSTQFEKRRAKVRAPLRHTMRLVDWKRFSKIRYIVFCSCRQFRSELTFKNVYLQSAPPCPHARG